MRNMGTRSLAECVARRAALRLPAAVREDYCCEWVGEIAAILEDGSVRFGWRRAIRALWFAVDQWRGLSSLARVHRTEDASEVERVPQPQLEDDVVFVHLGPSSAITEVLLKAQVKAQVEAWWRATGRAPSEVRIVLPETGRD
jgi:hypothetical protein